MKMENPLEPVGRAALAASREMLALEPQEKAQALRLMAPYLSQTGFLFQGVRG